MAKLGKMEAKRVDPDVVSVLEHLPDEIGCFCAKYSHDSIEGRYLYLLASAVADEGLKIETLIDNIVKYLVLLDHNRDLVKFSHSLNQAENQVRLALKCL